MVLRTHVRHSLTDLTLFAVLEKNKNVVLKGVAFGISKTWKGEKALVVPGAAALEFYWDLFNRFLNGAEKSLHVVKLDMSGQTDFQKKVLQAARSIPWGSVVSYSDLARMSGFPNAARAVASVMRNNDFPLVVPCHRVIRKNGSIGGFMGATKGEFVELKKKLLEREEKGRG